MPGTRAVSPSAFECWASVHGLGSWHAPHTHRRAALSAVFFAADGGGEGGDLVFDDPRGAWPPFQHTWRVPPTPGELVVFPGWLIHRVEPSGGGLDRISITCNVPGDWEATSDLNLHM